MKISRHCYAIQGLYFVPPWSVNSGFVVGTSKTLIIDTGCNTLSAQTIYGYAKAVNPDNEIMVVNTEKHLDHIGGNSYFRDNSIDVYGHYLLKRSPEEIYALEKDFNFYVNNTVRKNANEGNVLFKGSRIENPNKTVSSDQEIDLGGIVAKILITPGHTNTNLSVYIPRDKVLFSGDTIVNKFIPNLEEGDSKDWKRWLESLDRLKDLRPDIVVPGHGECINGKDHIKREIDRIKSLLLNALKEGKAPTIE